MSLKQEISYKILSRKLGPIFFSISFLLALLLQHTPCPAAEKINGLKSLFTVKEKKSTSYKTIFSGNSFLKSQELLNSAETELEKFDIGGRKKSAVDDAAFQMELAYRSAGFPNAVVDYQVTVENGQTVVTFSITEGQRVLLETIQIKGSRSFDEKYLLGLDQKLKTLVEKQKPFPYVAQQIKSFSGSLSDFYLAVGYLDAQVDKPELVPGASKGQPGRIIITIEEGEKYVVENVFFQGLEEHSDMQTELQEIAASMEGGPYNPRIKLFLRSRIQEHYQNKGYADATINVETVKQSQKAAVDMEVLVVEGERATVQEITVQGNDLTSEFFIRKRMSLAVNKEYSLQDERDSFSALYQTGLFSKVSLKLDPLENPGEKKLIVALEEKPTKEFFIEPGWGSYELLRFATGYTDKNLFGSGKNFRLEAIASSKSRQISAGYTDPLFLDTSIIADAPLYFRFRQEPEYTIEESGASVFFSEKFKNKARVSAGYSFSFKSITDTSTSADPTYEDNNYKNGSINLILSRDTRDDFFLPEKGYRGIVSLEYAGPFLGGDLSYLRFSTGVRIFRKIREKVALAMRYNTGFILPGPDQKGLPLDERFFNGGENSVRSFRESKLGPKDDTGAALGGTAFNTVSLELRRKLTAQLAGSFFIDAGNIAPNRTIKDGLSPLAADRQELIDATWKDFFSDFRYGVGCGLQYLLPIGPARLDIAFNPDRRTETESEYALHLSIGMAF